MTLKNPTEGVSRSLGVSEPCKLCLEIFLRVKVTFLQVKVMFLRVKVTFLQVKAPSVPAPAGNAAGGQQFLLQGGKKKKKVNFANRIITHLPINSPASPALLGGVAACRDAWLCREMAKPGQINTAAARRAENDP